ncbi:hypothetical protein K4K59_013223 [Colletotrichum sp. SAR11_240]|nr:hypothetical protein K4K59_013223 [Colletotrichum sp. SAR11_240]
MDVITESELAKHYEVHNLWVSIRGKVYDVSSYVDDHPGGVEVLKDVAGSDGTESFEFTKTLEYYKEVWEYPSYFSCKANRANI